VPPGEAPAGQARQRDRRVDLATLIGLIGGFGLIIGTIAMGTSAMLFLNPPSVLIVVGGTIAATLIKFPLGQFLGAFKVALKAFVFKLAPPAELIDRAVSLSTVARKGGLLALENEPVEDPFFKRGIQLSVDGHDPEFVRKMLTQDMNLTIERHEKGQSIFKAIGDSAPAMGMIGTLIGLVQMLASMDDPKSIGPAMAVALLTTLYGAIIANLFALPIADKLAVRSAEERLNKSLIIESISGIQEGQNPRVVEELLKTFLPGSQRDRNESE
jgi:chemotaxis protein MotA